MSNFQQSQECCTCTYLHNPIHDTYTPARRLAQYEAIQFELPPPVTIKIYNDHEAHITQIKVCFDKIHKV